MLARDDVLSASQKRLNVLISSILENKLMLIFEEQETSDIKEFLSFGIYLFIATTSIPGPTFSFTQLVALVNAQLDGSIRYTR